MSARNLYINGAAATGQVLVSAALMLLLYRYLLDQLGAEKLGVWSLVLASGALARLADFGLGGGVIRFVASDLGAGNGARAAQTVGMSVIAIGSSIGLACVVLFPGLKIGLRHLIVDPVLQEAAIGLIPWALLSLWVGAIAQVFLGTLDACQRGVWRVGINVMASAGQLIASILVVPKYGLSGLGAVQLTQSGLTLILAVWFVARVLRFPIRIWFKFDRDRFFEALRFGSLLQASAVAQLLFDPTVKVLLSHFGGLSNAGYYEVANRAVLQFRSIIVSAYQMLIPHVAHRLGGGEFDRLQVLNVYRLAHSLLIAAVVPYFTILAAFLPSLLTLWIGHVEPIFIAFGIMCIAGWALNSINTSSYMIFIAMGHLRWTMISHLTIGVLCLALGALGGWFFAGYGVVFGAMAALALGSIIVQIAFHVHYEISFWEIIPQRFAGLIAFCLVSDYVLIFLQAKTEFTFPPSNLIVVLELVFVLVCAIWIFRDPTTKTILSRLRSGFGSNL